MSTKIIHEDTFKTIMSAVNKLCDFIKPTYGPASNKAIISKQLYRMVVDDGVQIARDFELENEAEDAVVKVIREVAIKTNDRVGDGTTSSLIILQAIMKEIEKQHTKSGRAISLELKKAAEEAKEQLLAKSKKISTKEEIERVAKISFDHPEIAKIIAELLYKIGKEGVVTIDQSNTLETTSEHVDGLEIKQGFISPYMVTDPQRMEAVLEKPHILITSYRLMNANDVLPVMNLLIQSGKRELLIICDNAESDALATLIVNRVQGKFTAVAIQAPQGEDKKAFLEDIAILTGATMFTEEKGNRIDQATLNDLGKASRIVIKQGRTIIMGGKGAKTNVEKAKARIKDALASNPRESEKNSLELRLARLVNGIAVIKVGAPTENETKALKYKVEDAINATKSALNNGIVCGGGIALSDIHTSSPILNKALKYPHIQLLANMGLESMELKAGEAYNAVTGEKGPYLKVGVIDPVDVLIAGIESAVSIAGMLATTHGILYEEKPKQIDN